MASEPLNDDSEDENIIVCELHAVCRPLGQAAHRPALAAACLGVPEHTPLTVEHIARLVLQGYLRPLRQKYPGVSLSVYPAGGTRAQAELLFSILGEEQP